MRLSYVSLAIGAGLAIQQTTAVPIRVVVVTKQDIAQNGLDMNHADLGVASLVRPTTIVTHIEQPGAVRVKHKCGGLAAKAAEKSAALAQMFRESFGFKSNPKETLKILPFIGTPVELPHSAPNIIQLKRPFPILNLTEGGGTSEVQEGRGRYHHDYMHKMSRFHRGNFLRRINHALVSLGTWEGRIVAFVLGCGIGVLLRMVWVLGVVLFRSFKGTREVDEADHETIYYEGVVLFDETLEQPPQYTAPITAATDFPDEKKDAPASDN